MKTNTNNTALSAIATILEHNSHFTKKYVNSEFADFKKWKSLNIAMLHKGYAMFSAIHNGTYTDNMKNEAFSALRDILHYVGKINGVYIPTDAETVDEYGKKSNLFDMAISLCWKFGIDKVPTLQLVESKLKNTNALLREYESKNGIEKSSIESLKAQKTELEEERKALYAVADNALDTLVMNNEGAFMKSFEKVLKVLVRQYTMKTLEENLAEKRAREEARKARRANKNK